MTGIKGIYLILLIHAQMILYCQNQDTKTRFASKGYHPEEGKIVSQTSPPKRKKEAAP